MRRDLCRTGFSDTLGQVFRAIMANKLRSFLTMFGIAWGVGSLLVLVGLGEGFRSGQHKQLATFGNDLVMMWNGTIPRWPTSTPACGPTSSRRATKPPCAPCPRCARHGFLNATICTKSAPMPTPPAR
jgi:hypothetical protein